MNTFMYDLGVYIWTVWTVATVTSGGSNNRSIIQWRFYGRTSFIDFHIKGKVETTYNTNNVLSFFNKPKLSLIIQLRRASDRYQFFQILRPRNMILTSLVTCIASAILLVVAGGDSKYGLYTGAGISL